MVELKYPFRVNFDPFVTYTGVTLKPMCCVKCWVIGQVKRTMEPTLTLLRVQSGTPIFSVQDQRLD